LKLTSLKNQDWKIQNQSCDQIKKLGKQIDYCKSKFLQQNTKEKTVECIKNFCKICCEDQLNCIETCQKAHSLYMSNDPEELIMKVCSYKSMGNSFHGFCVSMFDDKNQAEYEECFRNFCFDCCSNELTITDFNDPSIIKCMKICQPPNNGEKDDLRSKEIIAEIYNINKSK